MVLGRFKQNSAVLYPSSYLGEICGEGGSKVRKGKRRSLTSLLLCRSSLNVCTEELGVLPVAEIHEHKRVETSRTEAVWKVNCFVCHSRVSSSSQAFWLYTADSYINRWKAQFPLHCFCPLCSGFHKECHYFVCLNQRIPKWRSRLCAQHACGWKMQSAGCSLIQSCTVHGCSDSFHLHGCLFGKYRATERNNSPSVLEDEVQISSVGRVVNDQVDSICSRCQIWVWEQHWPWSHWLLQQSN